MGIQPHLNASHLKNWGILAPGYLSVARTQTAVGHKNKPSAVWLTALGSAVRVIQPLTS
jgi:hypothetical protein